MNLSALILAKNEQDTIGDCLKQLSFVDEIIVLDQDSQDKTAKIAVKFTDKIIRSNSEDFAKNRNILKDNARGKWLLYVDCDERLPKELILSIKKAISSNTYCAYYIPRKNYILGKFVKNGGWWPDYAPRLFRKKNLINWSGRVHESPKINGKFGYFKEPLVHLSGRNLNQMLQKSIKWAKIEADLFSKSNNPKVTIVLIIKASLWEFFRRYFVKLGFKDGVIGLVEAVYQTLHQAIVFTYLWEIQNKTSDKFEDEKRKY